MLALPLGCGNLSCPPDPLLPGARCGAPALMPAPKRGRGSHPAGWRVIDHAFPCSRPIGRRRSARPWMSGPTKAAAFDDEAALTFDREMPMSRAVNIDAPKDDVLKIAARHDAAISAIEPLLPRGTRVVFMNADDARTIAQEIGRASCRERVCQYV